MTKSGNWPDPAKALKRAAAVLAIVVASLAVAQPAQAHYDPWNTHWHRYSDGSLSYKQCSVWDALWGCQPERRSVGLYW